MAVHNARLYSSVRTQAMCDELTGLFNRRYFFTVGRELWGKEAGLAIVLFDVDHFKSVNDTHGHDVGDLVLKTLARLCREQVREGEVLGRLGGEEFGILLPGSQAQALEVAERVRRTVEGSPIVGSVTLRVTVSLGVAGRTPADANLEALLKRADVALYDAKQGGRNQVCGCRMGTNG
jgi:diguanylate cyclase (GGDEF)-like protein